MVLYSLSEYVNCLLPLKLFSFIVKGDRHHCYEIKKNQFSVHNWQSFSLRIMATLKNKRKVAAVSRDTPEITMNSQSQNTFDPGMAQEYISRVSEEIEGRVTKKLSKKFSWTESRFLGALSELVEFLLNPQVRTFSVAVSGTSRNNNSENREPTGDRSPNDPCPKAMFSACHSSNLNDSEQEETYHKCLMQVFRSNRRCTDEKTTQLRK